MVKVLFRVYGRLAGKTRKMRDRIHVEPEFNYVAARLKAVDPTYTCNRRASSLLIDSMVHLDVVNKFKHSIIIKFPTAT